MRRVPLMLLLVAACDAADGPESQSVLETDVTSYVATDATEPQFDYGIRVIAKIRNTSEEIVRVARCLPSSTSPRYFVDHTSNAPAAWDPTTTCGTTGVPYLVDLLPGEERTDTLNLRAPWQRSFNGEPIGDMEGEFYLIYETNVCRSITATDVCMPRNRIEYVRSNKFTIQTP